MKKVYTLSTCMTCKRILGELDLPEDFEVQDVKKSKITEGQLVELHMLTGSYKAMINLQSRKAKALELSKKELTEEEYKQLLLEEYTLLKRPFIVEDTTYFMGNGKATVAEAKDFFAK